MMKEDDVSESCIGKRTRQEPVVYASLWRLVSEGWWRETIMSNNILEQLRKISEHFPKQEPLPPTAFASGVAEQLRDIAAQIETGDLVITHFSMTAQSDNKQRLEIEVA